MKKENIKWIAIQPLTGGMYLGAEEAIGHPAEAIISYKGLRDMKKGSVANEHYLDTYLKKHNRMPEVYEFEHGMFDRDYSQEGDLDKKFEDIDLIVAVPVCSGLSMATSTGKSETKDSRNCNMKYITHYALTQIKPKAYIFENAPGFMSGKGEPLRAWMEKLATETGYSITYYKTDTMLHNNCQKRPRTFIVFTKTDTAPVFNWEKNSVTVEEYLKNYPKSEYNNDIVKTNPHNYPLLDFIRKHYGENWREQFDGNLISKLIIDNKLEDFRDFVEDDRSKKYIDHILYKKSIGKNYFAADFVLQKDYISPVQFRSIPYLLHYKEDRTYTVREYLSFMGMPADFEWYGNEGNLPKIGQNVPVKTAKFIVNETVEALLGNRNYSDSKFIYQDNIHQKMQNVA